MGILNQGAILIHDLKVSLGTGWTTIVVGIGANNFGDVTGYSLLGNILLENNVFKEMTGPAFEATSFGNLVIRQNSFINVEKAPLAWPVRGPVRAGLGSGL